MDVFSYMLRNLQHRPATPVGDAGYREHHYNEGAVYLFSTPSDEEIVYVGRTNKVRKRLQFHTKPSGHNRDLAKMVTEHPDYPQDYQRYLVRQLELDTQGERRDFELYVERALNPPFNRRVKRTS